MRFLQSLLFLITATTHAVAQPADTSAYSATDCPPCKGWNEPSRPYHLHGSTYYVGTRGLAAILIASLEGHVLIDGGLPESAPLIRANITSLGFQVRDVKLILNSHAHHDHAGGLAALQRMSGGTVAASAKSAPVIRSGRAGTDDPQYAIALPFPAVSRVRTIADGDTLAIGSTRIVALLTPGHTSGGTSWSWRSCEAGTCLDFVYADSQTPVSADGFFYTKSTAYPMAISDFENGFAKLEHVQCDVLLTPHPGASNLWNRIAGKDGASLVDSGACRRYAGAARQALEKRKQLERTGGGAVHAQSQRAVPVPGAEPVLDGHIASAEYGSPAITIPMQFGGGICAESGPVTEALLDEVREWFARQRTDSTFGSQPLGTEDIVAESNESVCRSLAEAYAKLPGEVFTPESVNVVRVGRGHFVMFDPNVMAGDARSVMIFDSRYVLKESRPIIVRSVR